MTSDLRSAPGRSIYIARIEAVQALPLPLPLPLPLAPALQTPVVLVGVAWLRVCSTGENNKIDIRHWWCSTSGRWRFFFLLLSDLAWLAVRRSTSERTEKTLNYDVCVQTA